MNLNVKLNLLIIGQRWSTPEEMSNALGFLKVYFLIYIYVKKTNLDEQNLKFAL